MRPCISVLIRLYNGIEYLNESLDSVLAQTYTDLEVLIGVNGHGPDGNRIHKEAEAIVASKNDTRARVYNLPPSISGGAAAMNALAALAAADWVAILDVDDLWHPLKLSRQMLTLETLTVKPDVVGTQCVYIGDMSGSPSIPSGYIEKSVFREYNPIINSSVVMRRNLVDFTEFCSLDDYDLWCRLSIAGKTFFNDSERLTFHRIRNDSYYNASKKQDPEALRRHYYDGQ